MRNLRTTASLARRYSRGLHELATNRNGRRIPMLRGRAFDLARAVTPVVSVDSRGISYFVSTSDRSIGRELFALRQFEESVMERAMQLLGQHLAAPNADGRAPMNDPSGLSAASSRSSKSEDSPGLSGSSVDHAELPLAGRIFIDVGANIGTATIPALLRYGAAKAIAFEPDERCFRLLRHNLLENDRDNDLVARVMAERAAAWDQPGTASFELVDSNWGDGRVRPAPAPNSSDPSQEAPGPSTLTEAPAPGSVSSTRPQPISGAQAPIPSAFEEEQRATTEVPLVTLDGFLAERGIDVNQIGLLWVDAQGAEFHVLNGARSLLSAGIPAVIEYWPYGLRRLGGLDELGPLIAEHYTSITDLRLDPASDDAHPIPANQLHSLRPNYETGAAYTDLLLLP